MKNRTRLYVFIALISMVWALSCTEDQNKNRLESQAVLNKKGEELMKLNCLTCHSSSTSMDDGIAPPMFAVKQHYKEGRTTLDEFSEAMIQFLMDPKESASKMPGAIQKFGLMPKVGYTEEQMLDVAEYIFYADFQKPDWFDKHYEDEHGTSAETSDKRVEYFKAEGLRYAMATKSVLGKNLMGQITSNGPEQALEFCNERAIHLTDSMATDQSVRIRRVSDKPRNAGNRASAKESAYILAQKKILANGVKPTPLTFELEGREIGYYPIMTNAICLQCHGDVGDDVMPQLHDRILELYPSDEAVGYGENELRGIWVVEKEESDQ